MLSIERGLLSTPGTGAGARYGVRRDVPSGRPASPIELLELRMREAAFIARRSAPTATQPRLRPDAEASRAYLALKGRALSTNAAKSCTDLPGAPVSGPVRVVIEFDGVARA
ncbi:MAG TPA: hypothetical protein VK571_07335 [Gemmatimonadaceae bacterium]|nr:hypothetical protein [Gemmatimonadaceae bacterium]